MARAASATQATPARRGGLRGRCRRGLREVVRPGMAPGRWLVVHAARKPRITSACYNHAFACRGALHEPP